MTKLYGENLARWILRRAGDHARGEAFARKQLAAATMSDDVGRWHHAASLIAEWGRNEEPPCLVCLAPLQMFVSFICRECQFPPLTGETKNECVYG